MKGFRYTVTVLGKRYEVEVSEISPGVFEVHVNGKRAVIEVARKLPEIARKSGRVSKVSRVSRVSKRETERTGRKEFPSGEGRVVNAPMTGVVTKILKNEGDRVAEGETVLIIEAMKMENPISSPFSGVITTIPVKEGTRVSSGDPLFFVK